MTTLDAATKADGTFIDIWVNCPDQANAEALAETLVEEGLAACANIFAPVSSLYRWKGKLEREQEVPLALKSRRTLFETVSARIRALHPYETPSIIAMDLPLVDAAYAGWLAEETKEPGTR